MRSAQINECDEFVNVLMNVVVLTIIKVLKFVLQLCRDHMLTLLFWVIAILVFFSFICLSILYSPESLNGEVSTSGSNIFGVEVFLEANTCNYKQNNICNTVMWHVDYVWNRLGHQFTVDDLVSLIIMGSIFFECDMALHTDCIWCRQGVKPASFHQWDQTRWCIVQQQQ